MSRSSIRREIRKYKMRTGLLWRDESGSYWREEFKSHVLCRESIWKDWKCKEIAGARNRGGKADGNAISN